MSKSCNKCKVVVADLAELIKCCECSECFHPSCTRIRTNKKFKRMGDNEKETWKCDDCKTEESSHASSREGEASDSGSAIMQAIQELNKKMDKSYSKMSELDTKLDVNTNTLQQLQMTIEGMKKEQTDLKADCDELRSQNNYLYDETRSLRGELRELQQYTRRENLEVVGIPVTSNEDVYDVLSSVAGALKVTYSRGDVSVAHRLAVSAKAQHPPIIVKFLSRTTRDVWLAAAREKKRLNTKDINPNLAVGNVFINEHLTGYNKLLLSRGKALVKAGKLSYAWARDGKVLIRKTPGDRAVRVDDVDDFKKWV